MSMNDTLHALYDTVADGRRARGAQHREATGERKVGDVRSLAQRHHEILDLHVIGKTNQEIADYFGCTAQSVSQIVNSSLGQEKIRLMRGARDAEAFDVRSEIEALLPQAVDVYREILARDSAASLALKKRTADTLVMDIAGHKAPTKFQGVVAHLDSTTLDLLKQRGREAGIITINPEHASEASPLHSRFDAASSASPLQPSDGVL